jgi:uncharacterized protein (TIGR00299 family) protein
MVVGALIDAGAPLDAVREAVASLGLAGLQVEVRSVRRGGLAGKFFTVSAPSEHAHRHLPEVLRMLSTSSLPGRARERAEAVFRRLAEAEGRVHGIPAEQVHFHEVGAADSLADIVGAAAALEALEVDEVNSGPPALGHGGTVKCAHGRLPVPVPAVLELCRGFEVRGGLDGVEMTTPTGAAILTALSGGFSAPPDMKLSAVGLGAGSREDPRLPNFLRVMVGESSPDDAEPAENLVELSTVLDDVSGEVLGYLFDSLPPAGAVEVSTLPCTLKKNRPGHRVTVLAPAAALERVTAALFRETGTLGIRYVPVSRVRLERRFESVTTSWGSVRIKCGFLAGELVSASPEYEDCRRLAADNGVALVRVQAEAARLFARG